MGFEIHKTHLTQYKKKLLLRVQAAEAEKEVKDIERQMQKAAAAEPVTAESAATSTAAAEGQVAEGAADSRPASLKKSQDAAAERSSGEQIGDTGMSYMDYMVYDGDTVRHALPS